MYTIVGDTDPETSIHQALYGTFLPDGSKQVLVVGSKTIRIFRVNPYVPNDGSLVPQLECISQFTYLGPIVDVDKVRLPGFQFDCFITAFDDYRFSIQYIHPSTHEVELVSIHELPIDLLRRVATYPEASTFVTGDPDGRCVLGLVKDLFFLVVPIPEKLDATFFKQDDDRHPKRGRPRLTNYEIRLTDLDPALKNITDIVIQAGQYLPTAIVLYEPKKTTSGKAYLAYDTMCICAVSFNLHEQQASVTWQMSGLPMTIQRLLVLPEPVNSILLCGVNELVCVHQYAPYYGVKFNSNADEFTKLKLHDLGMSTAMDGVVADLINPYEILLGNRRGELFVATIDVDAMNSVRSIVVQKVFEIPAPSALIHLSRGYVYVPSKLHDSVLLKYKKKTKDKIFPNLDYVESIEQKGEIYSIENVPKGSEDYEKLVSRYFYDEEEDQIEILEAPIKPVKFKFSIIQTFLNTSPFKDTCVCAAEELDDVFTEPRDEVFDIAAASGHTRNSKLVFMERTIRPNILYTREIPNIQRIFAIGHDESTESKYLFLSRELETVVTDIKKPLSRKLQFKHPFVVLEGTLAVGMVAKGQAICQVTSTRIIIVVGDEIVVDYTLSNVAVVYAEDADISDPFIVLTLSDATDLVFRVGSDENGVQLTKIADNFSTIPGKTTALCVYRDTSGLFVRRKSDGSNAPPLAVTKVQLGSDALNDLLPENADDDSRHFYVSQKSVSKAINNVKHNRRLRTKIIVDEFDAWESQTNSAVKPPPKEGADNVFVFLAKDSNVICVYGLQNLDLVFVIPNANSLWTVLVDDPRFGSVNQAMAQRTKKVVKTKQAVEGADQVSRKLVDIHACRIVEIGVFGVGPGGNRPVLAMLVNDVLTCFEAFPYDHFIDGHLLIRFKKIDQHVCIRRLRFTERGSTELKTPLESITSIGLRIKQKYINFIPTMGSMRNVIFITGGYPTAIFMGTNGLFFHPLTIDGNISAITYFSSSNVANGFAYITREKDLLRGGELCDDFPRVQYDTPYPCRAVPMPETVEFLVYDFPFNLFAVVTSTESLRKTIHRVHNDEEVIHECEDLPTNFVLPLKKRFMLRLFNRDGYDYIPRNEIVFEDFEVVMCCEQVVLSTLESKSRCINYIAIGTGFNSGIEIPSKGRLLIYEIIEVVPEADMPTTCFKFKMLSSLEQRVPITTVTSIDGVLFAAASSRVFMYRITDEGLVGSSIVDFKFMVTDVRPYGSYALCLDMFRSVHLIHFQKEYNVISELTQDDRPDNPRITKIGYVVDNDDVNFLYADQEYNLVLLTHRPSAPDSKNGQRFIIVGGFRIGLTVSDFIRIPAHFCDSMIRLQEASFSAQTTLFNTKEGSWGYIRPLTEQTYRRLFMVQNFIESQLQQLGGLNPAGARAVRPHTTGTDQSYDQPNPIIDANLILQFLSLDSFDRREMVRRLGMTPYQLIDDLAELTRIIKHF